MERAFMKGCEAIAEAAVRGGCRFFAGYPITPQSEIPEYFSHRLPEVGGVFVQGESEIASVNMVFGAAAAGARAMTSSSGPGLSLKSEGISSLAANHVPAVLCNVMRGGPSTGSIQGAQSDYFQATKASGHGGFRMIVYAPSDVQEAVDYTYKAFDIAERDRNPVLILADGYIGAMMEPVTLPDFKEVDYNKCDWALRGRGDGPRRAISQGSLEPQYVEQYNIAMEAKYKSWQENDVEVEEYFVDDAEVVVAAFGTAARLSRGVIDEMRSEGYKVGMIRPITLSPFPYESFAKLDPAKIKTVLDVEMTIPAQMVFDVKVALDGKIPTQTYCRSGGMLVKHDELKARLVNLCEGGKSE